MIHRVRAILAIPPNDFPELEVRGTAIHDGLASDPVLFMNITPALPVVALTANATGDRQYYRDHGMQDVINKPLGSKAVREVIGHLFADLADVFAGSAEAANGPVSVGALVMWPQMRRAQWNDGPLDLTSTEFNLLEILCRRAGRTISKEDLSMHTLGRPLARYDRSIDVHVSNLRQKLGALKDGRSPIQTVRGIGYQLVVE